MRYFKFGVVVGVGAIFLAVQVFAQQSATTSPGVPPDFAASANARLNYYRAMSKLPPIVNDSAMSAKMAR